MEALCRPDLEDKVYETLLLMALLSAKRAV